MLINRNEGIISGVEQERLQKRQFIDFKLILRDYGIIFQEEGYYLKVGEINQVQGWILHLSVSENNLLELFRVLVPVLQQECIPFYIIRDTETARHLQNGDLGYEKLGKTIALYPQEHRDILLLAKQIIELTSGFRGPFIPTDRHLGSIVYTRYGSYNPVKMVDHPGKRFIYDKKGALIPDEYIFPFILPTDVQWPFESITSALPPQQGKLLKDKYKLLTVLKDDVKGQVIKGIYMKGFLNIKQCVIKEGKKDMWLDDYNRDIQDRLRWQFELYNDLRETIPIPEIFDFFEANGDQYLAMEFIKGASLENIVYSSYMGRNWMELPLEKRLLLLDYLIKVVNIIAQLHEKEYVHRDISPANFLIDKGGQIFLIDLELSYSLKKSPKEPPFKLGTWGYMSPEQVAAKIPTIAEDLYAIGALMIFALTGMPPQKFNIREEQHLADSIKTFIGNNEISKLIADCLSKEPESRPAIEIILNKITSYRKEVIEGANNQYYPVLKKPDEAAIDMLINSALNGLKKENCLTEDLMWDSVVTPEVNYRRGNISRGYLPDLYNGISGIVYCIAIAHKQGYDVSGLIPAYEKSMAFLHQSLTKSDKQLSGVYHGRAGVGLAIAAALEASLVDENSRWITLLLECFNELATGMSFAHGVSGQGMALLLCGKFIEQDKKYTLLKLCADLVVKNQLKDGSWPTERPIVNKRLRDVSFATGIPGIVSFLLAYNRLLPDERIVSAIRKSLSLLEKIGRRRNGHYFQEKKNTDYSYWYSFEYGIPGIAFSFIKAYQQFKEPLYKKIVTSMLSELPDFPLGLELSQSGGLAGLGEVYLEAFETFGDAMWEYRADGIVSILRGFALTDKKGYTHWSVGFSNTPLADLMTGNCGIIHFLIKYRDRKRLSFLLAV